MKNLKLKSTIFSLLAIVMVTVFLSSCEKDYVKVHPNENLNKITLDQLKLSQQIWNEKFSDKITLLNYEYVSSIENESDKQEMLKNIADDAKIIAVGNINQPEFVKVEVLKENSAKANITKDNLRKYVKNEIEISQKVIALNWDKNGEQFTTYCIANKDGIVWDNLLGGVIAVDPEIKEESGNGSGSNKMASRWYKEWWTAGWLWGSKRGEIGYRIEIYYSGNNVSNTDVQDWGNITLGKSKSESKIVKNSGSYGKIKYALGLCTPTGTISFNHSNFSVSVGGLGSDIVRNGYKSLYP